MSIECTGHYPCALILNSVCLPPPPLSCLWVGLDAFYHCFSQMLSPDHPHISVSICSGMPTPLGRKIGPIPLKGPLLAPSLVAKLQRKWHGMQLLAGAAEAMQVLSLVAVQSANDACLSSAATTNPANCLAGPDVQKRATPLARIVTTSDVGSRLYARGHGVANGGNAGDVNGGNGLGVESVSGSVARAEKYVAPPARCFLLACDEASVVIHVPTPHLPAVLQRLHACAGQQLAATLTLPCPAQVQLFYGSSCDVMQCHRFLPG